MERMNEPQTDAVIVSVFGRGNWLAMELATKGWKVSLVDVTDRLGPWEPEDAEGPFGLFESSDLVPSQKTRLTEEGETQTVKQGMTFWLPAGPLECKSELTAFHLQKRGVPHEVEEYLRFSSAPSRESEKAKRVLRGMSFDETWLAQLAHQMASGVFIENHRALDHGIASPVFVPFSIRRPTKLGTQKGLKACQAAGVNVRAQAGVLDMRLEGGRQMDAIEVEDTHSGIERGRAFVWMLSEGETRHLRPSLADKLFTEKTPEPEWLWMRYRVSLRGRVFDDQIPLHVVAVEDIYLRWSHVNLLVLRKRIEPGELDAWIRVPSWARFDREYSQDLKKEIERVIEQRIPLSRPEIIEAPIELRFAQEALGPARFPVFGENAKAKSAGLRLSNLFYDSPEQWETLDWLGAYRHQNMILAQLEKLKAGWDAEARRQALKSERAKGNGTKDASP